MSRNSLKIVLFILATFISLVAYSQELQVRSFRLAANDISAVKYQRLDLNGRPCALIKVGLGMKGVKFPGSEVFGNVKYDTGEYWVYVVDGTKKLKVMHEDYAPLYIDFGNYPEQRLDGGRTYVLILAGSKSDVNNNPTSQQAQGNFLIMKVTPTPSQVSIDNGISTATDSDGSFKVYLDNGSHSYRVEAGNAYSPVTGTIEMKGERITLPVTLKSVKATLAVNTTTSGSKIYINEDYKGTDSWQGELTPGTYLLEARKDGFRTASKTVTLAKQQTESITLPALQQISGSLMVDYEPVDADVYLDNTLIGKSPNVFTNLAAGKHNIKISKAGYADYTGSVTIQENQQASISGSLTKGSTLASASNAQTNISSTNTVNGYDWVDLGLSVKWATKNIGADSPSDYGGYYAWGETRTKSSYTWSNCFDCLDDTGDSWGTYKIGGKTRISPTSGHDTARENWGGTWRMPTIAEFEELCKKCTWTWTTQGGHNGYLVTSQTNGKSIFLPAAGWRYGSYTNYVGEYGYFWSSTLSSSYSIYARGLRFGSSDYYTSDSDRSLGQSVRPVPATLDFTK